MDIAQFTRCRRLRGLAVTLLLTSLVSGCGRGIHPVEGHVVWKDGSPAKELKGAQISFELAEKQTSARGTIQEDGSFRLTTKDPGDGALAGEHKVVIVEVGRKPLGGPDGTALAPGAMDSRYSDPSTTDLRATIKRGTNKVKLTVERAPRS